MPWSDPDNRSSGAKTVAIILATGISTSLILISVMALVSALRGTHVFYISENATQVLSGVFGAIIGALAGYLGRNSKDHDPQ